MGINIRKEVDNYASVAFSLLGVLFGMGIMVFIFGNLGPETGGLTPLVITVTGETGAFINTTGYTLAQPDNYLNARDIVLTSLVNYTSGASIPLGNATLSNGIITNATAIVWPNVSVSYQFTYDPTVYAISQNVTIDSLDAVQTYSSSSDSQFTTVSIAVVLVLLLSVFFLFWRAFKGSKSGGRSNRMSDASSFS